MEIPVAEIFGPTIQGEGPNSGCKCIFVRVVGCDFKCDWCFGIMPSKYRVPRVLSSEMKITEAKIFNNLVGIPLDKVQIGDKILTYNDDMQLVETEVKDVIKHKEKCLKIKINYETYLVTPEHPFFTEKGLVKAKDLQINDKIIKINQFDLVRLKKSFNGLYNQQIQYNLNHMDELAKKLAPYYEHLYQLNELQSNNLGKLNGNYKNGNPHKNWLRNMINNKLITKCSIDGLDVDTTHNLIIHHIDENPDNDDFTNLIVINRHYHDIHHQRGYNFHQDTEKNKSINYCTVKSIEPYDKEIDVVNLSCEPYNTYLADGMWVHNCDSQFAWKINENTKYYDPYILAETLINKCKESNTSKVILTGGNPCIYNFSDVVKELHEANITVDVETQGSILPDWLYNIDQLVISPKAPSSGQKDVYDNIFKFLNNETLIPNNYKVSIKIPVFNDEDFIFAKKYNNLVQSFKYEYNIDCRLYINVGNTNTSEEGDISNRILNDYKNLIEKVCNSDLKDVYIMPQIHTLVWGNKQGV